MSQDTEKGNLARFFGFCKRTALFAALDIALSLAIWLGIGLFQGRLNSPAGALFVGAIALFGLAILPFFLDMGSTLLLPLRVFILNKDAREILEQDRSRSETGVSLTFQFAAAGALVLLLSFLVGRLFEG